MLKFKEFSENKELVEQYQPILQALQTPSTHRVLGAISQGMQGGARGYMTRPGASDTILASIPSVLDPLLRNLGVRHRRTGPSDTEIHARDLELAQKAYSDYLMQQGLEKGKQYVKVNEDTDIEEARLLGSRFLKKMKKNKKMVEQAKQELIQFIKDNPDKLKRHGVGYWAAQIARKYDGIEGRELAELVTGQKHKRMSHSDDPIIQPPDAIRHMGLSRA